MTQSPDCSKSTVQTWELPLVPALSYLTILYRHLWHQGLDMAPIFSGGLGLDPADCSALHRLDTIQSGLSCVVYPDGLSRSASLQCASIALPLRMQVIQTAAPKTIT